MIKKVAKGLSAFSLFILLSLGIIFHQDLQEKYVVNHVKGKVVYVLDPSTGRSGGTGFLAKAKSGSTVIVTNEHVCNMAKEGKLMLTTDQFGELEPKRAFTGLVAEKSKTTDLCIIQPVLPNLSNGLTLADSLSAWERIYVIGHPHLEALTSAAGTVTNFERIELILDLDLSSEDCSSRGGHSEEAPAVAKAFGVTSVCFKNVDAARTTANVFPGNSGSPVLNKYGNLVGVLFAGNNDTHFGYIVPLRNLKEMLEAY